MTALLLPAEERWANLMSRAADMSALAPSSRYWHQSWNNHNFDPAKENALAWSRPDKREDGRVYAVHRYAHRACLQTYWPRHP
jgi:hypothetical protein